MTEPTELAKLRHLYQNMVNGAVRDTASAKRIAEGLLAPAIEALERGTPPAVTGEPVAWLSTDCIGERYLCFTKPKDSDPARPLVFGDATPQPTRAQAETPCRKNPFYHGPRNCSRGTVGCCEDHGVNTHPQAGAVPLTKEQRSTIVLTADTVSEAIDMVERHYGIKGGQHGAE